MRLFLSLFENTFFFDSPSPIPNEWIMSECQNDRVDATPLCFWGIHAPRNAKLYTFLLVEYEVDVNLYSCLFWANPFPVIRCISSSLSLYGFRFVA